MPSKSPKWCPVCSKAHEGECPERKAWVKPVYKKAGGRGGRPWRRKRERVFQRDGFICQLCKRNGRLTVVTLHGEHGGVCDHVVALEFGGSDDEFNLQTICKDCDKEKTQSESQRGRGRNLGSP